MLRFDFPQGQPGTVAYQPAASGIGPTLHSEPDPKRQKQADNTPTVLAPGGAPEQAASQAYPPTF